MTPRSEIGQAIFIDLSKRAKFRITGADRLRFLNGQITNDLRKASETSAIEACILNAKGKTDAHIYVSASGDSFLVDAAADLNDIIPIEANLEQRAIDYQKGCYIGQEVISRIKMSGQTNKRLCGLISLDNLPLQPGMKLAASSAAGKEAGWITSATRSKRLGKEIALGYVKRGFNRAGTNLDVLAAGDSASKGSQLIRVEVVPLPFV